MLHQINLSTTALHLHYKLRKNSITNRRAALPPWRYECLPHKTPYVFNHQQYFAAIKPAWYIFRLKTPYLAKSRFSLAYHFILPSGWSVGICRFANFRNSSVTLILNEVDRRLLSPESSSECHLAFRYENFTDWERNVFHQARGSKRFQH